MYKKNRYRKDDFMQNYKAGDVITYRDDICAILNAEPATGNTKKSHMKQIEQYMKLERIGKGKGTKYQIVEIYETPQEKQDGRKDNTFVQRYEQPKMFADNQIEKMVLLQFLRHFYNDDVYPVDEEFSYTMERINYFASVGLCNHNYKEITGSRYTLTTRDIDWVDDYYCHSKAFDLALGNSYQSMQSKVLGSCYIIEPVVTVCLKTGKSFSYHTSSVGEYQLIEDCKKQAIRNFNEKHNLNLDGSTDVHYKLSKKQKEELYDDMTELVRASGIPYFSHCVSSFKITAKKEYVKERLTELGVGIGTLDEVNNEIKLLRDEINQIYVTRQHERIENAHDKVVKKVETKRQEKKLFGKRPRSPEYVLLEEEQIGKAHNLVDCSHKHLSREEHKEAQKLLCYCKN